MAAPIINNLLLPGNTILVLPDEGSLPTTGKIFRWSSEGGGHFLTVANGNSGPVGEFTHILFVREMTTEVNINGVEYLAMYINAVVGLIPD